MKKLIVLVAVAITSMSFAQEQGKFRGSVDIGYAIPTAGGGGILANLEGNYNIMDNLRAGFRIGTAALARELEYNNEVIETNVAGVTNFALTLDKSFGGDGKFQPFVGAGIGYYAIASTKVEFAGNEENIDSDSQLGGVVRAGLEFGKFRLVAEYNFIPKTEYSNSKIENSYFGVGIGFFVGGGKWGN